MVYTNDSKSFAARLMGSSPISSTVENLSALLRAFDFPVTESVVPAHDADGTRRPETCRTERSEYDSRGRVVSDIFLTS